jgi:hypothetical protein
MGRMARKFLEFCLNKNVLRVNGGEEENVVRKYIERSHDRLLMNEMMFHAFYLSCKKKVVSSIFYSMQNDDDHET